MGAFSVPLGRLNRKSPYLPGDNADESSDLDSVSSAQPGSPARSRTGGATAPDPGAGANPTSAYSPSVPHLSTTQQPSNNIIRDAYMPELKGVSDKLQSAYEAPRPGMFRQVAGALLSRKNPAIGGLVSGETQRQRTIEPLQQQYGLISSEIGAQRAADAADIQNRLHLAEAGKDVALGQQATAGAAKDQADVAAAPGKQALTAAQEEAAHYKEDPNLGLVDLRTGQPVGKGGSAPLSAEEAQVLGKNTGDLVPLKIKNTANEISMRGSDPARVEMNSWLSSHPGKTAADYGEYKAKLVPGFNFNLQNASAAGQGGQPSALAKGLADGSLKWNDVVSPRTPMAVKQQILSETKGMNPNFNSGDFAVEQAVREKYTSGNVSDQLRAIGTAREHMKTFSQIADALDNNNVQALNRLGNEFGIQFGSDKATNFRIASQAFGGEVGKAFDGAGVVAGEREQAQKNFNDAMSKGQFKGAIQTVDKLLAGKQKASQQAYASESKGKPNFGNAPQSSSGSGAATHRFNPATGQIEAIQ